MEPKDDQLYALLQKQIEICGDVTEFVTVSVDLLKKANDRINDLENIIRTLEEANKPNKKKKKSPKK